MKPFEYVDLICGNSNCEARHILLIRRDHAIYDRDTRRYPSEFYDDNEFPIIKLCDVKPPKSPPNDDSILFGPIVILRRKKRFSLKELQVIYARSNGKCHLCLKPWAFSSRSKTGWHVDHVIPNAGGGWDTEQMENFRVACARCNLKKGRGYTFRTVRLVLEQLWDQIVQTRLDGKPNKKG